VALLLGDPAAPKGLRWDLGTVELPPDQGTKPSPVYRTARVQPVSNLLPNIEHTFVSGRALRGRRVRLSTAGCGRQRRRGTAGREVAAPRAWLCLWVLRSPSRSSTPLPPLPFHPSLDSNLDDLIAPLPQRPAEKRPPAVVSLAFSALALAPLAALVLWLLASGALSLPLYPSGPAALFALLFHAGIGALLFLYFLFWTKLNLAQTLPFAAGLGLFISGVGYKALSAVADARLQRERATATPAKKTN
jgi:hypothetical protein